MTQSQPIPCDTPESMDIMVFRHDKSGKELHVSFAGTGECRIHNTDGSIYGMAYETDVRQEVRNGWTLFRTYTKRRDER